MKERPILFSGEMVRAILDGRKTQTRRIVKLNKGWGISDKFESKTRALEKCPYGKPGDRLWVRETFACFDDDWRWMGKPHDLKDGPWTNIKYAADAHLTGNVLRPSIHMPRWASRITLEITDVRVERLCDISEPDAAAEGAQAVDSTYEIDPVRFRRGFQNLWDSIYKNWDQNPWVWVIEFKRIHQNLGG